MILLLFYCFYCRLFIFSWWWGGITFLWLLSFNCFPMLNWIFHEKIIDFRFVIFCAFPLVFLFTCFLIFYIDDIFNFNVIFANKTEINMLWSWWNSLTLCSAFSVIFLFWSKFFFFSWHGFIVLTISTVLLIFFAECINMLAVRWCHAIVHDIWRFLLFDIDEYRTIMIVMFCFFVIFNFGLIRVAKESFKLIVLFGIEFRGVDNKVFKAVIFTELKLRLILIFTETLFSF